MRWALQGRVGSCPWLHLLWAGGLRGHLEGGTLSEAVFCVWTPVDGLTLWRDDRRWWRLCPPGFCPAAGPPPGVPLSPRHCSAQGFRVPQAWAVGAIPAAAGLRARSQRPLRALCCRNRPACPVETARVLREVSSWVVVISRPERTLILVPLARAGTSSLNAYHTWKPLGVRPFPMQSF